MQEKHGNEIPRQVTMEEGLYLGHIGPRYINAGVVIGKNCNINQECYPKESIRCPVE